MGNSLPVRSIKEEIIYEILLVTKVFILFSD